MQIEIIYQLCLRICLITLNTHGRLWVMMGQKRACLCTTIGSLIPSFRPLRSTRSHSRAVSLCIRTQNLNPSEHWRAGCHLSFSLHSEPHIPWQSWIAQKRNFSCISSIHNYGHWSVFNENLSIPTCSRMQENNMISKQKQTASFPLSTLVLC